MEQKDRYQLEAVYRMALVISAIDLIVATVCAINGDIYFVPFMMLACFMWGFGVYIKAKAEEGD